MVIVRDGAAYQRNYSIIIDGVVFVQKEFGIKRILKKGINKIRNKWADNIQKSIDKSIEKNK